MIIYVIIIIYYQNICCYDNIPYDVLKTVNNISIRDI